MQAARREAENSSEACAPDESGDADSNGEQPMAKLNRKQKRLLDVFTRFVEWCDNDDALESAADKLDEWMDEIRRDDGFGTEGQCDPRGDGREGDPQVRDKRTW